jgi:hypothetical protein
LRCRAGVEKLSMDHCILGSEVVNGSTGLDIST